MNPETLPAGLGRRLIATLIDIVVVPLVAFILMIVTGVMESAAAYAGDQPFIRGFLLGVAAYLVCNGWWLAKNGQTLGKKLLGIRLIASKGGKAPFWKLICIRALFFPLLYLLPFFPYTLLALADLAPVFASKRRCLHDFVSGTDVVMVASSPD